MNHHLLNYIYQHYKKISILLSHKWGFKIPTLIIFPHFVSKPNKASTNYILPANWVKKTNLVAPRPTLWGNIVAPYTLLFPWTASIPYTIGIRSRVSSADLWNPSTISAQSEDKAFSNGPLPPALSILPNTIDRYIVLHNQWRKKDRERKRKGTDWEVFHGRRGSDPTFYLGHLAHLFFQSHARKKVLDSSFNGFIWVSVYAIQVLSFFHLELLHNKLLRCLDSQFKNLAR